jgi:hypothetical protein
LNEDFSRRMAGAMGIAGAVILPLGLVLSGVLAGWKGLAGSFVGFGVASVYTAASISILKWALKKPADMMPTLLLVTMWGRLLVLAAVLLGLTYVHALNSVAMLFSFLALFIAYTVVEVVYSYKAFGLILRAGRDKQKT